MNQSELSKLSKEELIKKQKNTQTLMGLLMVLTIALAGFCIKDYMNGIAVDNSISIITLCTLGGTVSLFPELKKIKEALSSK